MVIVYLKWPFLTRTDLQVIKKASETAGVAGSELDETDSKWTIPNEGERALFWLQFFEDQTFNGAKTLHLAHLVRAIDQVYSLPAITDFAKTVWNLIPADIRKQIQAWAKSATAQDKANIASAISVFVKAALAALGIPGFVISVLLGVLLPEIVEWIIANISIL